jgi:hypothetical protein
VLGLWQGKFRPLYTYQLRWSHFALKFNDLEQVLTIPELYGLTNGSGHVWWVPYPFVKKFFYEVEAARTRFQEACRSVRISQQGIDATVIHRRLKARKIETVRVRILRLSLHVKARYSQRQQRDVCWQVNEGVWQRGAVHPSVQRYVQRIQYWMHVKSSQHHWLQVFSETTQLIAWGKRVRVPHLHGVNGGREFRRVLEQATLEERDQHLEHHEYNTLGHQGACVPAWPEHCALRP